MSGRHLLDTNIIRSPFFTMSTTCSTSLEFGPKLKIVPTMFPRVT